MTHVDERVFVGLNEYPRLVKWNNKVHKVEKIGLHHTYREGKSLYHVFSLTTKTLFMRLIFDTETLTWRLTDVEDGI